MLAVGVATLAAGLSLACGQSGDAAFGNAGSGAGSQSGGDCKIGGQACPVLCDATLGLCVDCLTDKDCSAAKPSCVQGECEECGDNGDCKPGESCFPKEHTCEPSCSSASDCQSGSEPICDPATSACVGCLSADDCPPGEPLCSEATGQCVECLSGGDCGTAKPICDVSDGKCRECLVDGHCPASAPSCVDHDCVTPATCDPGKVDCGEAGCVDVSTDPQHCGGCGKSCDPGQSCVSGQCTGGCAAPYITCGGQCVDGASDPLHCGGCDKKCGGDEHCSQGQCVCKPGLTEVSGSCVDLQTDANNCGEPGKECGGGTPLCKQGGCVSDCGSLDTCGEACVDTDTNPLYCGGCDKSCKTDEICVDGNCRDWQVAVGCNTCPCPAKCVGDFDQCCTYPGKASLVICVDGDCP